MRWMAEVRRKTVAVVQSRLSVLLLALGLAGAGSAATFGTVVPISGNVADIALDEARGRLYAANFGAYRVEVINTLSKTLQTPIASRGSAQLRRRFPRQPLSWSLANTKSRRPVPLGGFQVDTGGLTTYDLNTGNFKHLDLPCPVLTVSFGGDGNALVVCRNPSASLLRPPPPAVPPPVVPQPNIFLLNPVTNTLSTIGTVRVQSQDLPLNPTGDHVRRAINIADPDHPGFAPVFRAI